MRIGVDCRSLQEAQPSGVSFYTQQLLRAVLALPQAQQHSFVLFFNGHSFGRDTAQLERIKKRLGVQGVTDERIMWRIKRIPNKVLTSTEILASSPSERWMFGDVDVVFIPNMQFYPIFRSRIPYVLTVHDLSFIRYPECLDIKGKWRHRLLFPRSFIRRAKSVISVSQHTKEDIVQLYGVDASRIHAIYPGVSAPDTDQDQLDTEALSRLPEKFITTLSAIEPRKNIETLLQAFQRVQQKHPDVHLVITGGAAWKSGAIMEQMRSMESVHTIGYVSNATKHEILKRAAVFVYPSLYEGFGFPPLEAQQAGTPVVVGAHSSLPEVLGESALYADIVDVQSVANAIQHLLTDQVLAEQYIQAGKENVQRFQWEHAAERTLEAIEKSV